MGRKCLLCESKTGMHGFPKESIEYEAWVRAINKRPGHRGLAWLCKNHFPDQDFTGPDKFRLKTTAIPTLRIAAETTATAVEVESPSGWAQSFTLHSAKPGVTPPYRASVSRGVRTYCSEVMSTPSILDLFKNLPSPPVQASTNSKSKLKWQGFDTPGYCTPMKIQQPINSANDTIEPAVDIQNADLSTSFGSESYEKDDGTAAEFLKYVSEADVETTALFAITVVKEETADSFDDEAPSPTSSALIPSSPSGGYHRDDNCSHGDQSHVTTLYGGQALSEAPPTSSQVVFSATRAGRYRWDNNGSRGNESHVTGCPDKEGVEARGEDETVNVHYGTYVTSVLNTLPQPQRAAARLEIHQILSKHLASL